MIQITDLGLYDKITILQSFERTHLKGIPILSTGSCVVFSGVLIVRELGAKRLEAKISIWQNQITFQQIWIVL